MTATAPHLPLSRSPSSLPPPKTFLSDESFLPLNVRNFSTPSLFLSLFFSLSPSYLTQFPLFSSSFCLGLRLRRREGGRKGEEKFCLLLRPAIERGRRERPAKETSSLFFLFVLLLLLPRRPQRQKGMGEGRPSKEAAPPLLSLLPSSPRPPPPPRALVP